MRSDLFDPSSASCGVGGVLRDEVRGRAVGGVINCASEIFLKSQA